MESRQRSREFNKQFILGLKPESSPADYYDKKVTGFGVRVSPGGKKTYFFRYRRGSSARRKVMIGSVTEISLADARTKAHELTAEVKRGGDPQEKVKQERAAESVRETVELFINHSRENNRPKTAYEDARYLNKEVLPVFGSWKLQEVRRKDIVALLERVKNRKTRNDNGSPIAANRLQQVLSRLFEFCVDRELLEQNPIYRMRKLSKEKSRNRVLTDKELKELMSVLHSSTEKPVATALLLTLTLARRKSEIFAWRWNEINRTIWTIPAERSKNKRAVPVPLPSQALELLERLNQVPGYDPNGFVFPSPAKKGINFVDPKKPLARLKKGLSFADFTIHDLRRTAATRMRLLGITREHVEAVLGHAEGKLIETYHCDYPVQKMSEALQRWADFLDKLQSSEQTEADNVIDFPRQRRVAG